MNMGLNTFARLILLLISSIAATAAFTQGNNQSSLPRPKLVVGIVVDQMRWDYLYRYYDRYGTGGFRRMLSEGFTCENTIINYLPTKTAIGHASVYTGTVPAIHGIAGNDFIEQKTGAPMYCVGDSTVQAVGSHSDAGKMSPKNLLTTTVTDELKLATNFRSKNIGISIKDRGAILPAGHAADAAYWMEGTTGNWISSSWYMKELPEWVKKLNEEKLVDKYLREDWNTLYPIDTYLQSTPDLNTYETPYKGTKEAGFPVRLGELAKTIGRSIILSTPFGNTLTLDMAKRAVENENLGNNTVPDFLAISLSSTDYVGPQFGINSIEVEDTYLRLDKDLADFFDFLDKRLGKGSYTVFLTADHGAPHNPGLLNDHRLPGGWLNSSSLLEEVNAFLEKKYGQSKIIRSLVNNEVHLDYTLIRNAQLDENAIRKDCVDFFQQKDEFAWAVDLNDLANANLPTALLERLRNGYHRERSGVIFLVSKTGYFPSKSKTGVDHGHWSPYDSHIPLVWMGWGIKHGSTTRQISISDIAPTVSFLLHIQLPSGSIGEPISEILEK